MSLYVLQKMVREINRDPQQRERYFASPETFAEPFDLTPRERDAFLRCNVGELYRLGVHGLLLRPFSIIHKMPEAEYLTLIRKDA